MQIYLAARYSRFPEMQDVAERLRRDGHIITSRWIEGHHDMDEAGRADRERFAIEDIEDLTKSDMVISFTENINEDNHRPGKGGRHVEFGLALALNKRTIVIGPQENVFHCLPSVEVYAELSEFLNAFAEEGSPHV